MEETSQEIRARVRERFARLATDPSSEQEFAIGLESAIALGYDSDAMMSLPPEATASFAGVGNPLALADLRAGEIVADIGCGSGVDLLLAARRVAERGRVIGVDQSPEMMRRARQAVAKQELGWVELREGEADHLPIESASVDVVITNGVFNLCLDKPGVAAEFHRVLHSNGRLIMADILLEEQVTPEEVARKGSWSG